MDVSKLTVLMAEDDPNDVLLFSRAFQKAGFQNFKFVADGAQVLDYLRGVGGFEDREVYPFPNWLILDLKMPKLNGFEVLAWIKGHPSCGVIPTIIFSSSFMEADVRQAYKEGANTFFTKPHDFAELKTLLEVLMKYWCIAQLPDAPTGLKCS